MPTENKPERTFIVLSLKHTHRRHKAITLWRPNDSGYCWTLERAGIYGESLVLERLGYYNSGCSNISCRMACGMYAKQVSRAARVGSGGAGGVLHHA